MEFERIGSKTEVVIKTKDFTIVKTEEESNGTFIKKECIVKNVEKVKK